VTSTGGAAWPLVTTRSDGAVRRVAVECPAAVWADCGGCDSGTRFSPLRLGVVLVGPRPVALRPPTDRRRRGGPFVVRACAAARQLHAPERRSSRRWQSPPRSGMRLKQSAAPLLARIARLVAHLVPHREPNDPIQDQSWDSQIEQKYQAVSRDHADLILSIWPPVDRDSDGTVAYGM
jgi:hypothetical protein